MEICSRGAPRKAQQCRRTALWLLAKHRKRQGYCASHMQAHARSDTCTSVIWPAMIYSQRGIAISGGSTPPTCRIAIWQGVGRLGCCCWLCSWFQEASLSVSPQGIAPKCQTSRMDLAASQANVKAQADPVDARVKHVQPLLDPCSKQSRAQRKTEI